MQVQSKTARIQQIACVAIAATICFFGPSVLAQDTKTDAQTDTQADSKADSFDQKKVVRAIYDATKTAKTKKDFDAFIAQCDEALAAELSAENRKYVVSLSGWGLNRRGEKNYEMAVQLKRIGNAQHEAAMKQGIEDFDAAIVAAPERYRSWMSRGIAHVASENYDRAILDFTEVVKLKTDNASGWFNRAEALYERGNYEHAIRDYDVALRLNSDDAQAQTGRGLSSMALGQFEDALADFDKVISSHPKNDAAYINRGDAQQELGNWQLALKDYEQAVAFKETGIACQRFAWLKATCPDASIQDSKIARKMIDRAIALDGKTAAILDTLAATEAAEGDFDAAKTTQQKVIGLVSAEEDADAEPYQARLTLYEKSEPFVQQLDDESDDKGSEPDEKQPEKTDK